MKLVGYFQIEESSVYHVVYVVEGNVGAWTLCGLRPRNREGDVHIFTEPPISLLETTPTPCMNCQAVQDSGMIRIKEFEAFLNRAPTRETHPECYPPKEDES